MFKILFKHVENFHNKSTFYSSRKKFCVVENPFPIIEKLNLTNTRKRAKNVSTYDFSTLCTNPLEIMYFVFKSKVRSKIEFSATSIYWTSEGLGKRYLAEKDLAEAIRFSIKNCYFTIGNMEFIQNIGIPIVTDPAPFWTNLFLYFFES